MLLQKLLQTALISCTAIQDVSARALAGKPNDFIKPYKRGEPLQDIVTWDEHSLLIRGERVMLYSGEFHPFRNPVPSLHLDIFQKIKALGYNCVSFYTHWALHEGKPGNFSAEGIFGYEEFFKAAAEAGIYLIARPGPYINAEVSGGGFPGWLQRVPGTLRTADKTYLDATENYMANIGAIIADAQITNGGPVILVQPENEYTSFTDDEEPDQDYFIYVEEQLRRAGIVVPLISNEAFAAGYVTPDTKADIDIYGFDGYPLGFDCANPQTWPDQALSSGYADSHAEFGGGTPFSILEFQGGSFDPWGGWGFAQCQELVNYEFERVFYKNNFAQGVTILNLYMTWGGTNWGNLGHPGGYTSYDYAAVISEERLVDREKYSEAKLEANFIQASPAYLTAQYQNNTNINGSYTGNADLAVTALYGNVTKFFVIRHAAFNSLENTDYTITLPTNSGNLTIPQLGGKLSLNGRDSKYHVTDYDVGGINLLYSTAEIFTWKKYEDKRVLVVYGGPNEEHELAVSKGGKAETIEGSDVTTSSKNGATVIHFKTSTERRVVKLENDLYVYLLDRNSAYNYWVVDLPSDDAFGNYTNPSHLTSAPIVRTDYLLRTVEISNGCIHLTGDLNATSPIEVIGTPHDVQELTFNGKNLAVSRNATSTGSITATADFVTPEFSLPDLSKADWKVIDSLPEIKSSYDDAAWTLADHTTTNNTVLNFTTPTSLYASDYGYHTGILLYRGHFQANGKESTLYLGTYGGAAFGHTIYLNSTYIGSFTGEDVLPTYNETYALPGNLTAGAHYVLTVIVDNNSLNENYVIGEDQMKLPRGVIDYDLAGHPKSDVTWKLTGNLGGEDFVDTARGPLNEGGLYAERAGYHLPDAPTSDWESSAGPQEGLAGPGIAFYSTTFDLDMPVGYDIPLSLSFSNGTAAANSSTTSPSSSYSSSNGTSSSSRPAAYRCQLFVNGYQFGKYVHNVGPQDVFPVPEGIWNFRGSNTVAVSLWVQEEEGAKVEGGLTLVAGPVVQSGFGEIEPAPQPGWVEREGVY